MTSTPTIDQLYAAAIYELYANDRYGTRLPAPGPCGEKLHEDQRAMRNLTSAWTELQNLIDQQKRIESGAGHWKANSDCGCTRCTLDPATLEKSIAAKAKAYDELCAQHLTFAAYIEERRCVEALESAKNTFERAEADLRRQKRTVTDLHEQATAEEKLVETAEIDAKKKKLEYKKLARAAGRAVSPDQ